MEHDVFEAIRSPAGSRMFFSAGIAREFGVNKLVNLIDGGQVLAEIQPLKVDPAEFEMRKVGTITV